MKFIVDTHLLHGRPPLLLMVATGNISNHRLLCLFETHISLIAQSFEQTTWVELNREGIILHG
jgi:predicted nuclease of predicted toxin-antitoxin system